MSKNVIFALMYHHHKLLDLIWFLLYKNPKIIHNLLSYFVWRNTTHSVFSITSLREKYLHARLNLFTFVNYSCFITSTFTLKLGPFQ
jgi:hypothetical protein